LRSQGEIKENITLFLKQILDTTDVFIQINLENEYVFKETKKTYEAQISLGEEKDTDDVEGITLSKVKGFLPPSTNEIEEILKTYVGKQKQLQRRLRLSNS